MADIVTRRMASVGSSICGLSLSSTRDTTGPTSVSMSLGSPTLIWAVDHAPDSKTSGRPPPPRNPADKGVLEGSDDRADGMNELIVVRGVVDAERSERESPKDATQ